MRSTCRCAPPTSTRTRGYFNGPSVFLLPGRPRARAVRGRDRAAGRRGLRATGASPRRCRALARPPYGFGPYRAANYDELIDHPVETGDFALATFDGRRRPARHRDLRPAARRPRRGSRATSRACANGRSTSSAARPSIATCSRSRPSATATAGSSTGRARASCAAATSCRMPAMDGDRRRLPHVPRAREPRVFPRVEREAHQARGVRALRPRARELHAAAVGVRGHHVVLRRSRARALRAHRRRALSRAARRARSPRCCADPGRHVQSVADSSFDAWIKYYRHGREHAQRGGQLLRQGRARRLRARPDAARRRRASARRPDARAVGALRTPGIGVPEDGIARLASELAGRDLSTSSPATSTAPTTRRSPSSSRTSASSSVAPRAWREGSRRQAGSGHAPRVHARHSPRRRPEARDVLRDGPAARAGLSAQRHAGRDRRPQGDAGAPRHDARAARAGRRRRSPRVSPRRADAFTVTLVLPPADTCFLTLDGAAPGRRRGAPPRLARDLNVSWRHVAAGIVAALAAVRRGVRARAARDARRCHRRDAARRRRRRSVSLARGHRRASDARLVRAQDAYTRSVLDALPGRAALRERVMALGAADERDPGPAMGRRAAVLPEARRRRRVLSAVHARRPRGRRARAGRSRHASAPPECRRASTISAHRRTAGGSRTALRWRQRGCHAARARRRHR